MTALSPGQVKGRKNNLAKRKNANPSTMIMSDYYDIYSVQLRFSDQIDGVILKKAFETTCMRRGTISLIGKEKIIVEIISNSVDLKKLWDSYRIKYEYAYGLSFEKVIEAINALIEQIQQNQINSL